MKAEIINENTVKLYAETETEMYILEILQKKEWVESSLKAGSEKSLTLSKKH